MNGLKEMIKSYRKEAKRLSQYRKKLIEEMKSEQDTDKLHQLELRIYTLETERYEIMDDIRAMQEYEGSGQRWRA